VKILDLGCGQGAATWFLSREGYNVAPVDGSEDALRKMKKWLASEGMEVPAYCADICKLPFPDKHFDAVVDIVSMAHNTNYADVLKEAARVLKVGGRMFSMIPASNTWKGAFDDRGEVVFLNWYDVQAAFKDDFQIKIGWVETADSGLEGRIIRFWIIDAKRIDSVAGSKPKL
jgi:ubiquinone/menaquinone biosynthesis C-methylase UbiE